MDELKQHYSRQTDDALRMYDSGKDHVQRRRLDVIQQHFFSLATRERVADLGSGDGFGTSVIMGDRTPPTYIALDLSGPKLAALKTGMPLALAVVGNVQQLPLKDGCVDLVLCLETLEHLRDPESTLRESRRVLGPNGSAIISVPIDAPLQRLWDRLRGALPIRQGFHEHVQLFTTRGFKEMLISQGWNPVAFSYSSFHLPLLSWFLSKLPYRYYKRVDSILCRLPLDHFGVGGREAPISIAIGRRYCVAVAVPSM